MHDNRNDAGYAVRGHRRSSGVRDDHIHALLHEFRGQGFSALRVALRVADLYEDVAADYPPALAQFRNQTVGKMRRAGRGEKAYPVHPPDSLPQGAERHGKRPSQPGQEEAAAVHGGMVGRFNR
jgi:hypothetical protein